LSDSKRRKQNRFHQTEKRGIHSNTQRQRKQRYSCKSRILREIAHSIANILPEIIEPAGAACIAAFFFYFVGSADDQTGASSGFGERHARADEFFDLVIDVEAEFFVEFGFDGVASEKGAESD
jgi:hypothetical protein